MLRGRFTSVFPSSTVSSKSEEEVSSILVTIANDSRVNISALFIVEGCNISKRYVNMKRTNLKYSTSRKSLYKLSKRQKRRIMAEVKYGGGLWHLWLRGHLRLRNCSIEEKLNNICSYNNVRDIPGPSNAECDRSSCIDCTNHDLHDINAKDNSFSSSSSSSFTCDSDDSSASFFNTTFTESSFRQRLASCFVDNNLTHTKYNNILSTLRTHSCFSALPKDARTLVSTPRKRVIVSSVEPGEYIHFDLETEIIQCFAHVSLQQLLVNWK